MYIKSTSIFNIKIKDLEDAELFEFSTQHFDSDSNRVIPGD